MKTDVILFKADIDGTYSSVIKVEVTKSFADYVLKEKNDEYFKTFGSAKKAVLNQIKMQMNYWKDAVSRVSSLKQSDIKNENY